MQLRSGDSRSGHWHLTDVQRAILAHRIRTYRSHGTANGDRTFLITTDLLDRIRADSSLPSVATQVRNIIRFIGDTVSRTGEPLNSIPRDFPAIIGSLNERSSNLLVTELFERKLVRINGLGADSPTVIAGEVDPLLFNIDLSLDGWEMYQAEKSGVLAGNYGFIAMQFDDPDLDKLVKESIKPTLNEKMGYNLVDMRDVSRAGIIDNIMREQIRNAKFVIADLSHDNSGAYWEAGYAEGLNKPVIYICERDKFDQAKTHFDTNHCTTVLWSPDNHSDFVEELIATVRRSIERY